MHLWAALWCPPCLAQSRRPCCGYRSGVAWLMAELTFGCLQFPGANLLQAPGKPPCCSVKPSFGGARALWRALPSRGLLACTGVPCLALGNPLFPGRCSRRIHCFVPVSPSSVWQPGTAAACPEAWQCGASCCALGLLQTPRVSPAGSTSTRVSGSPLDPRPGSDQYPGRERCRARVSAWLE